MPNDDGNELLLRRQRERRNRVGSEVPTITPFGLRGPADDHNPLSATPITGLHCQYPGYTEPTVTSLGARSAASVYKPEIARSSRVGSLCTFTPRRGRLLPAGTHQRPDGRRDQRPRRLQAARSRLPAPCTPRPGTTRPSRQRQQPVLGPRPTGRQRVGFGVCVRQDADLRQRHTASPIFNLVRVLPGAAGKSLVFKFFDVGDAASSGTMTVLRPTEATGSAIANCVGTGFKNQTLSIVLDQRHQQRFRLERTGPDHRRADPLQLQLQLSQSGWLLVPGSGELRHVDRSPTRPPGPPPSPVTRSV